ncbi:MAG: WYL domain-containing protein [Clostridia bacterium]|nr:WYL domain-containing protein [Clostridia bacterium]
MAVIRILSILKDHSDENHKLTHKQIATYLERDYGIVLERKAIASNLRDLEIGGFDIEITPKGAYLDKRELDDLEIRLLIDAVLGSKYIDKKHSKALIEKLCGLSNKYFKSSVKNIHTLDTREKSENLDLLYNIDIVNEAIDEGKQIQFIYNKYDIDKKLHPVSKNPYIITPYQLVLSNGNYYLLGEESQQKITLSFKLDRITKMNIVESKKRIRAEVSVLQISDYIKTHPYMYAGEPQQIKLLVKKDFLSEAIDFFGKDIRITKNNEDYAIDLKSSTQGIFEWAMQNGGEVEVLSPQDLRNQIRSTLYKMEKSYLKNDDDLYYDAVAKAKETGILILRNINLSKKEDYKELTNVKEVILENNNLEDVSFLANFKNLKKLEIYNNEIEDLSFIEGLEELIALDLRILPAENIEPIKKCKKLRHITLHLLMIEDYSPLYELNNIFNLNVASFNGFMLDAERVLQKSPYARIKIRGEDTVLKNQNDRINNINYDERATGKYPANLLCTIFGTTHLLENQEKVELLSKNEELRNTLQGIYDEELSGAPYKILLGYFEKNLSYKEMAVAFSMPLSLIRRAIAMCLRKLRHPSSFKKLKDFMALLEE